MMERGDEEEECIEKTKYVYTTHTITPALSTAKVMVVGATGRIGQMVVRGLVDRGYRVIALARDPSKFASLLFSFPLYILYSLSSYVITYIPPILSPPSCPSCIHTQDGEKAKALNSLNDDHDVVTIRRGDVTDEKSLTMAMKGCVACVSCQ